MAKYIRMKVESFDTPWEEQQSQGYQKEVDKKELLEIIVPFEEHPKLVATLNVFFFQQQSLKEN